MTKRYTDQELWPVKSNDDYVRLIEDQNLTSLYRNINYGAITCFIDVKSSCFGMPLFVVPYKNKFASSNCSVSAALENN